MLNGELDVYPNWLAYFGWEKA